MAEEGKVSEPAKASSHPQGDNSITNALSEPKALIVYTMCHGLPAPIVGELLKKRYGLKIPAKDIALYYYAVERNAHNVRLARDHSIFQVIAWFIASQVRDDATFDAICEFLTNEPHVSSNRFPFP